MGSHFMYVYLADHDEVTRLVGSRDATIVDRDPETGVPAARSTRPT